MLTIPSELYGCFPARSADAHKRSVGTVAVVGGSGRYLHAPVIAALGARAAGAGLVNLIVPDASRIAAGALVPEATFTKLTPNCIPPPADVLVAGMGLGVTRNTQMLLSRLLSGSVGRFVLDADALTVLALWYGAKGGYRPADGQQLVLTPHEGEAARLLGVDAAAVHADRCGAVRMLAERYGATVVLKGANTLVADRGGGRLYENRTGNPYMALGGTGDLLAGVIGARWAYLKGDPFDAAAASVWLHGAAGDEVVEAARDPSIANFAAAIGSLRLRCETRRF